MSFLRMASLTLRLSQLSFIFLILTGLTFTTLLNSSKTVLKRREGCTKTVNTLEEEDTLAFFFFLIELLKIGCGFSLIAILYLQSKNFRTLVILLVISNMVYK